MKHITVTFFVISMVFVSSSLYAVGRIDSIELAPPPIDMKIVNEIWELAQEITGHKEFAPPPIVLDWEVPMPFLGGYQFPTPESQNTREQVSIPPRLIDMNEKVSPGYVYYAIGHELLHYIFKHSGYPIDEKDPQHGSHHCLPEYQKANEKILDYVMTKFYSPNLKIMAMGRLLAQCIREGGSIK